MSAIHRKGLAVTLALESRIYFEKRRKQVDQAWGEYMTEVLERYDRGEEAPYRYGFSALSEQTDAFVRREAQRWARTSIKYRLYEDDFESHFRFTVAKAALRYRGDRGTFFDYLRTSIRNAGRDLVRRAKTEKRRINHFAKGLDDKKVEKEVEEKLTSQSAENEAVNHIIVDEMSAEPTLTEQERALFDFLRTEPDSTLQEMADTLGLRDRKQASRVKERLAKKLRKYIA